MSAGDDRWRARGRKEPPLHRAVRSCRGEARVGPLAAGRCLPYGDGIALWALGEVVKAECGILETDTPEEAAGKLERALPPGVEDRAWLLARLTTGIEPITTYHEHALASAQAQLLEAAGKQGEAARLYDDAADRWQQFGNLPERAYALLGHGRCLHVLGDPAAEQPLTEARELFASMGYKPALAEAQALLDLRELAAS